MKRKKALNQKRKLLCPVCGAGTYDSILKKTLGRKAVRWNADSTIDREGLFHMQHWACDNCLASGNAIPANPAAQLYCDYAPYLAYFDVTRICMSCGSEYIFKKEEQKYWYETLNFWVQSQPKHCPACRRAIRNTRNLNSELSALLKNEGQLTAANTKRASEIYTLMNKANKAKYYEALFRKLSR